MLLLIGLLSNTFAEEIVVAQSGQRIRLKDNGQWEYVSSSPESDIGIVLAKVNGTPIGSNRFIQAAKRKAPKNGSHLDLEERLDVLETLINEELLYQQAYEEGFGKDPKVQKVMTNALLRDNVYNQIKTADFSEQELTNYFYSHQNEFIVPEKVQIYNILIKVTPSQSETVARRKAEDIYSKLLMNPDLFKEIAATESEGPYKRRGGDVGFVPQAGKPGLDPIIVAKAFSLPIETLSTPFKTKEGWNIIYVPSKIEEEHRSYDKMKGSVLRKLKNERLTDDYNDYIDNIKRDAQIQRDKSILLQLDIEYLPSPSSLSNP